MKMKDEMLGKIVSMIATVPAEWLGTLVDLFEKLTSQSGGNWFQNLKKFLRKEACWVEKQFVVREKFIVGTDRKAKVKISELGNNFSIWFLGTVEDESPHELKNFTLDLWKYDRDIIAIIGGVKTSIISLGDVYAKMEKQPLGPRSPTGDLLVNGYANIGYVPQPVTKLEGNRFSYVGLDGNTIEEKVTDSQYLFEVNGQWFVLRAVHVSWLGGGWDVDADSVENPLRWSVGDHVFYRNSSILESSEPSAPAA